MFNEVIDDIKKLYNTDEFIPLSVPKFEHREKELLIDCIDSTYVSSVGKYVDDFEKELAKRTGAKFAILTSNGTSALHAALLACGVEENDEVITQSLTFVATSNAIKYCNAHPVYVDVSKDRMSICPNKLEDFLKMNTESKNGQCFNKATKRRIKVCLPMHTFGHSADLDALKLICEKYNLILVEDAAESLGSFYKGKHTGTLGRAGTLSFNGNKIITTGGGGAVITNDEALAKHLKHMTTTAKVPHSWSFVHDEVGYNYRMPNLNAALGMAQLERLDSEIDKRRFHYSECKSIFDKYEIEVVVEPSDSKSNYWLQAVLLKDSKERDDFLELTNNSGVMTRPIWELNSNLVMYKDCFKGDLTNSIWLADRVVNVPSNPVG